MKIVFFGSGKFALPIVKKLHSCFTLLGIVITKPRPSGRGLRSSWPEIGQWAQGQGIEVFAPGDPNGPSFIDDLIKLKPSLFVLSSYGHILGHDLLGIPSLGSLNVHPSLLPKYRGAAPIQRSIMAGEEKTGITIFFMDEKIDHGEMILQETLDIDPGENYGSLRDRLSEVGADLVVKTIESIRSGTCTKIPQNEKKMSYAPKIKKKEMIINWHDNTTKIVNLVRALSPKPGAETTFRERKVKIISAVSGDMILEPGKAHIDKRNIYVGTGDSSIILKQVKPQDRAVISGIDFKNGFHVQEGEVFG
jgi:methionyl-tRNA formyltransferase